jgi:hypothetical protein
MGILKWRFVGPVFIAASSGPADYSDSQRPARAGWGYMGDRGQICGLLALSLLSVSYLPGCTGPRPAQPLAIRIGLLADSQITSPDSTPGCPYRNRSLDEQIECTIRPPALEHLTAEMLGIALHRFPSDIDVILYLGDGANSGGENEIQTLFSVLEDYRKERRIPIFMVIGNHDYLGVGNTSDPLARFLLLNRLQPEQVPPLPATTNRSLTKYEVLERISEFNQTSSDLPTNTLFRYTDNRDTLDPALDHGSGLYLAGRLVCPKDGAKTVEIFLADTSDYANTSFKPELSIWEPFIPRWDFYGMQGSVSSRDREDTPGEKRPCQIAYLQDSSAGPPPDFRFIASHYPPDNLDRKRGDIPTSWHFELLNMLHGAWEMIESPLLGHPYTNQRLDRWRIAGKADYWLSAHTHRQTMMRPGQGDAHVGGLAGLLTGATFHNVNIGSTTDYRAHIAVVEPASRQKPGKRDRVKRIDRFVQFREIPLVDPEEPGDRDLLQRVLSDIKAYGRKHKNTEHCIGYENDAQFGMSLLGLNKDYQDRHWTMACTDECCKRLDDLLREYPDRERADIVRCLAFIASATEAGACKGKNGFDPDRCRLH